MNTLKNIGSWLVVGVVGAALIAGWIWIGNWIALWFISILPPVAQDWTNVIKVGFTVFWISTTGELFGILFLFVTSTIRYITWDIK